MGMGSASAWQELRVFRLQGAWVIDASQLRSDEETAVVNVENRPMVLGHSAN